MLSFAQSKQKSLLVSAWQGSVSEVRWWKKLLPTSPTAASGSRWLFTGTLHRSALLGLRLGRGEELGDDLDREDAGNPALVINHRRVLCLALQQVGERIAHHVVTVEQRPERIVRPRRHRLRGEIALGEPAERPPLGVDQQREGGLRAAQPRPHLSRRLAGA